MFQLDKLHQMRDEILRIARKHNAEKVYVFGSCARREVTSDSDVDLLVDFNQKATLFGKWFAILKKICKFAASNH